MGSNKRQQIERKRLQDAQAETIVAENKQKNQKKKNVNKEKDQAWQNS